jgi:tetratricopeptide (TPR) repeat protein
MSRAEQQLRDEVMLREASLLDARKEHAAGELSSAELELIEAREHEAIARATLALDELVTREGVASAPASGRVRHRRLLVVGLVCLAGALGVFLWSTFSTRQAGNSITGSIALGNQQKVQQYLSEAEADVANGNVVAALSAYQSVLAIDAKNVQALTQAGWLDFSAGSSDQNLKIMTVGVNYLRQAIVLAPRLAAPRLYYAIVADSTPGNEAIAKRQFEEFLALKPSAGQLAIAKPFLQKLGITAG